MYRVIRIRIAVLRKKIVSGPKKEKKIVFGHFCIIPCNIYDATIKIPLTLDNNIETCRFLLCSCLPTFPCALALQRIILNVVEAKIC